MALLWSSEIDLKGACSIIVHYTYLIGIFGEMTQNKQDYVCISKVNNRVFLFNGIFPERL